MMRRQFSITQLTRYVNVKAALTAVAPCQVILSLDRFARHPGARRLDLEADALQILREPNAGGNSIVSEALSMQYMHELLGAFDVVTEMRIKYWSENWKKVDYLCSLAPDCRIAVSVTRAMKFPDPAAWTASDAMHLLTKKLFGLVVARAGVCKAQRYTKSILHIWCQTDAIAASIASVYEAVVTELCITENVVLVATVAAAESCIFFDDPSIFK
ncbi:hypothetical protein SPRG_04621 [Saprolegnia parasitica CBS 223.65]|uniref:Uncharacterized protein n=1 Tax=Saprolegnia parasitica (strain CBS 223.65) TaxID=695850 RepID=A0A067CJ35_SAPPC|nr:hypothetical protein SPRG_04621 [Saprolegnia parasitica CBS 223.65]KDO30719.1 hypothetical protein SPRG_04621 [Saprolegnia parasitica CBS 223.65]|eukprot:XP_012198421.1 hypothetical protein SPRG_04621 [Saprolegnia parasitica CBS 223.65]